MHALTLLLLLLGACGTPSVLRAPPVQASMAPPSAEPPMPSLAEPTGEPRISLPIATPDGFTPPAAPRSGRAATP